MATKKSTKKTKKETAPVKKVAKVSKKVAKDPKKVGKAPKKPSGPKGRIKLSAPKKQDITITYAIFPTKTGKGYSCFAIAPATRNKYRVAAAFCSPSDRAKFSKKKARKIATDRLIASRVQMVPKNKLSDRNNRDLKEIISTFMCTDSKSIPRWAKDSFSMGLWEHTLRSDGLSMAEILRNYLKEHLKLNDLQIETTKQLSAYL